jgi:hypothetical protein
VFRIGRHVLLNLWAGMTTSSHLSSYIHEYSDTFRIGRHVLFNPRAGKTASSHLSSYRHEYFDTFRTGRHVLLNPRAGKNCLKSSISLHIDTSISTRSVLAVMSSSIPERERTASSHLSSYRHEYSDTFRIGRHVLLNPRAGKTASSHLSSYRHKYFDTFSIGRHVLLSPREGRTTSSHLFSYRYGYFDTFRIVIQISYKLVSFQQVGKYM